MNKLTIVFVVAAVLLVTGGASIHAQSGRDLFQKALTAERADGNLRQAIQLYEQVVKQFASDRPLVARALVRMAECYEKLGQRDAAKVYERVVREYSDQAESVALARSRLSAMQPAQPNARTVRQLWAGPDADPMGQPSADGRYLSFTDWSTGDLGLRDIVQGTSRRLTNTGGWERSGDFAESSAVSPDGRFIAYAWFTDKGGDPESPCQCRYDLRLIAVNGTDKPRVLHQSGETKWIQPNSWSADGRQLLVTRQLQNDQLELALITIGDGAMRVLTPASEDLDNARWSPDGRLIAVEVPQARGAAAHDIQIYPTGGGAPWPLIGGGAHDRSPIWSPDGTHVVFISDRTGEDALWRIAVGPNGKPTGAPILIMPGLGANSWLMAMTQTGTLFYSTGGPSQNVYRAELDDEYRAKGAPIIAVERFVNSNSSPSLSPDAQWLALLSRRAARQSTVLLLQSMATSQTREVSLPFVPAERVAWFPDSRTVLVATVEERHLAYHRVNITTGEAERLLSTVSRVVPARRPVLSPDGTTMFYVDQDEGVMGAGGNRLIRVDLATRRETVIKRTTRKGEGIGAFELSPDGKELAYFRLDGPARISVLELMTVDGSNVRELYRQKDTSGARFAGMAWTPDMRHIIFPKPVPESNDATALIKVPTSGGEAQEVGIRMPGLIRVPSVRDHRLIFSAIDGNSTPAVSVLENFLPRK